MLIVALSAEHEEAFEVAGESLIAYGDCKAMHQNAGVVVGLLLKGIDDKFLPLHFNLPPTQQPLIHSSSPPPPP